MKCKDWDIVEFGAGLTWCKILKSFKTEAEAQEYFDSIKDNYEPTTNSHIQIMPPTDD